MWSLAWPWALAALPLPWIARLLLGAGHDGAPTPILLE